MRTHSIWLEMAPRPAGQEAQALLDGAMACEPAFDDTVPRQAQLAGTVLYSQDDFVMTSDAFWFSTQGGVRFSYRIGDVVRASLPDHGKSDPKVLTEFELFLWGTVYGAVAWLNGMVPLHASAVVWGQKSSEVGNSELPQAIAFSGSSGSGKSTLAAGLSARGARQLCDDTLVVVPTEGGVVALPDKKPLKLWEDSLRLLAAQSRAEIAFVPGKHFAEPLARQSDPCLLTDLVMLEEGSEVAATLIEGAAKFDHLLDALYRGIIYVNRAEARAHGEIMTSLAKSLRVSELSRPRDAKRFDDELSEVERQLTGIVS